MNDTGKPGKVLPFVRPAQHKEKRADALRGRLEAATPRVAPRPRPREPLSNGWRTPAAIVLLVLLASVWLF